MTSYKITFRLNDSSMIESFIESNLSDRIEVTKDYCETLNSGGAFIHNALDKTIVINSINVLWFTVELVEEGV